MFRAHRVGLLALVAVLSSGRASAQELPAAGKKSLPAGVSGASTTLDLHGDPLPPGALARLGSVRFRSSQPGMQAVFSADGKRVLSSMGGGNGFCVWEFATGRKLREYRTDGGGGFSTDGNWFVTTSGQSLQIVDTETGKVVHKLAGRLYGQGAPAFSRDGKRLAALTFDKGQSVAVWDLTSEKIIHQGSFGPQRFVMMLALSPDGKTLAEGDHQGTIRLTDLSDGKNVRNLSESKHQWRTLVFAPDGKTLAAASYDGMLHLWDVASAKEIRKLAERRYGIQPVAFSPDSVLLATTGDAAIRIWDMSTGKMLRQWQAHHPASLAFSPDGKTIVSGGQSSSALRFWETATGRELNPTPGHHGPVVKVAFSDDGTHVYSGANGDQTLRCWQATGSGEKQLLFWQSGIAFSADSRLLALGHAGYSNAPSNIGLWSLRDPLNPKLLKKYSDVDGMLALSPDGKTLAAAQQQKSIRVWDTVAGKELCAIKVAQGNQEYIYSVALSADGKTLAISALLMNQFDGGNQGTLRLWDVAANKSLHSTIVQGGIFKAPDGTNYYLTPAGPLSFSPDGKWLFMAQASHVWDVVSGRELRFADVPPQSRCLAFSRDGRFCAWSAPDKQTPAVHILETASGRRMALLSQSHSGVASIAFSPNGRRLATGHDDSTILIWDLSGRATGQTPEVLSKTDVEKRWSDLAGPDPTVAYRALWDLVDSPQASVPFLEQRLRPAQGPDLAQLAKWVEDLDSERFPTRNRAVRELEALAELAEPSLRQKLGAGASLEAQRRIESLLEKLAVPVADLDRLRALRAATVLEYIGTPASRRLLEALAKGAPGATLTRAAQASLHRLGRASD